MLTLEACKALKALGYPQGSPDYSDCRTPMQAIGDDRGWYACPDSIDALDWLAARLQLSWQRALTAAGETIYLAVTPFQPSAIAAATPSALIMAVAQALA